MTIDTQVMAGESPFSEAFAPAAEPLGFTPWSEGPSPFAEVAFGTDVRDEVTAAIAEALDAVRDEEFDEAVVALASETESVIDERFEGEFVGAVVERERLGDAHLGPVGLEAERYLDSLTDGLSQIDVASLSDEQFDALLDSLDPQPSALSPASEQLIGSIVRKAKRAVKFVVKTAKSAAKSVGKVAGSLLGPVLNKLRALIRPLLKRVLSFAIGRLPAPLQGPARALAAQYRFEAEGALEGERISVDPAAEWEEHGEAAASYSPSVGASPEMLAEQFDEALAEIAAAAEQDEELESFGAQVDEFEESTELEQLAEARSTLISAIENADDGEDLTSAVENFVPALLAALRVGINLVGRPRVVGFLANYLGGLVRPYVGPSLARPLSAAIVDTGLKLASLETGESEERGTAAPIALAATIEDTVRRLAENEDYVLESDELFQLAASEAFEHAVATNFPARFVKTSLQQAPTLAGSFVTRRARSVHPFRRYSRVPEVDITEQVANSLRTFGGTTVGAGLRATGARFPFKAKVHVFEAVTGTTLPSLAAADRRLARLGTGAGAGAARLHPLTPQAAGLLLREPRLGAAVPKGYLSTRGRVAVGQRFYWLEPVDGAARTSASYSAASRAIGPAGSAAAARAARGPMPSQARLGIDVRTGTIRLALFLSEAESQTVAAAVRQGRGTPALLSALSRTFRTLRFAAGDRSVVVRRETPLSEDLSARMVARVAPDILAVVRRRVEAWFMTQISAWAKTRAEEFARASNAPEDGVTVVVTLSSVPGMNAISSAITGKSTPAEQRALSTGSALQGTPTGAISVEAGRKLRWMRQ